MKYFNDNHERGPLIVLAIALVAALGASRCESAERYSLHTVSHHIGVEGLNNLNPGLGYDVTPNLRVGAFYNSYKKPSTYVMGMVPVHRYVNIGAGLMSGYTMDDWQVSGKTSGFIPAVAVEVKLHRNLSAVWFGQAINLQVKF